MKPYSIFTVFFLVMILAACASSTIHWTPPEGKTMNDYNSDLADCRLEWSELTTDSETPYIVPEPDDYQGPLGLMMANAYMDPDFAIECMEKKGWVRQEK